MHNYFLVVCFLNIQILAADYSECGNECKQTHSLYSREGNKFLSEYHKALSSYENTTCDDCSCYLNVIEADLRGFKDGIHVDMLRACSSNGVKYQLIEGKWYRSKECLFPSRCEGVEYFLNLLRSELPDMELCINFHDWPLVGKHHGKSFPFFSFSKTDDYYDIMYPAWAFWKGGPAIKLVPEGLGRWDLARLSMIKAADQWPWDKKLSKAFFRGSRTSSERDSIVLLSRKDPDIADAAYTKNQAWKSDKDTLGLPPSDEVSLESHCKYKYLFNFRGVTASFRLKYLFLCKSLVIHKGAEWNEFFYSALKPWVHYVPLDKRATTDDYRALLSFLRKEDDISRSIALRGFDFVFNHLRIEDVLCYWKKLLLLYSEKLTFKPTRNLDLVLIKD